MLTRRHLLVLTGATLALAAIVPRTGFAQSDNAAEFVRQSGGEILAQAKGAISQASQRDALLGIVNRTLDVDGIARFALGVYWNRATPDQKQRFTGLFHQVISTGVTSRLVAYQDITFTVGGSEPRGDGTLVHSVIARPGSPPTNVDWLVGSADGQQKILDVIAEGTSLRLTERSDYLSYLQSHGGDIDALIQGIQGQLQAG